MQGYSQLTSVSLMHVCSFVNKCNTIYICESGNTLWMVWHFWKDSNSLEIYCCYTLCRGLKLSFITQRHVRSQGVFAFSISDTGTMASDYFRSALIDLPIDHYQSELPFIPYSKLEVLKKNCPWFLGSKKTSTMILSKCFCASSLPEHCQGQVGRLKVGGLTAVPC